MEPDPADVPADARDLRGYRTSPEYTLNRPSRTNPSSVTPNSRDSSMANDDGPPTEATVGMPAMIAFCTISKLARLLTARMASCSGVALSRTNEPITLSTALWRPTSSRTRRRAPARSKIAAPCTEPVAWKAGWASWSWAGRRWTTSRSMASRGGRGEVTTRRDSIDVLPQMPQLDVV